MCHHFLLHLSALAHQFCVWHVGYCFLILYIIYTLLPSQTRSTISWSQKEKSPPKPVAKKYLQTNTHHLQLLTGRTNGPTPVRLQNPQQSSSFSCSFSPLIHRSRVRKPARKTHATFSTFPPVFVVFHFHFYLHLLFDLWRVLSVLTFICSCIPPQSFAKPCSWSDRSWQNLHNRFPVCCALRGISGIFPVSLSRPCHFM